MSVSPWSSQPARWSEAAIGEFPGLDVGLLPRLLEGAAPAPVGTVAAAAAEALGRGSHSFTSQLNVSTFYGIRWVHDFPPVY